METIQPITDEQFLRFKNLIHEVAGIALAPEKKVLVSSRLGKRVKHYNLHSFGQYYQLVNSPDYPGEFQMMVDLLTTNETYFFREHQHFDFLKENILKGQRQAGFRAWSAASSSGEEVFTLAMVLAETLGAKPWEILGTDISSRMLQSCKRAVYPMSRASHMSNYMMHKYCLKGVREQEGMLLVDSKLRERCNFKQVNLTGKLPFLGHFDVIFVRNVMIYFDQATKKSVIEKLTGILKPGGYLFTSHSESLHGITDKVKTIKPSIYRKPER